jgi:hypothetical protein
MSLPVRQGSQQHFPARSASEEKDDGSSDYDKELGLNNDGSVGDVAIDEAAERRLVRKLDM